MSSSNAPYTHGDLVTMHTNGDHKTALGIEVRPHTFVEQDGDQFNVMYYGNRIATLRSDGSVMVSRNGRDTVSTINRINDVLIPLGWRIRLSKADPGSRVRRWMITTTTKPRRSMEYIDGMILTTIINNSKDN